MQRTLDNCTLIKKNVELGIGKPDQYYYLNKCDGYTKNEKSDDLCEQCKKCRLCTCNGLGGNR